MSNVEIFYFSGTGNSLAVARDIAAVLNATITPIIPLLKRDNFEVDADVVGLVFPLYDFKAPKLVDTFIEKARGFSGKYVFAVATYGFSPQKALKKLQQTLQNHGGKLAGGFVVSMPNNGIITDKPTPKRQQQIQANWNKKLQEITNYVKQSKTSKIETKNMFSGLIINGYVFRAAPKLLGLGKEVALHGWDSFSLAADDHCTSCGMCVQVCPMNNLTLTEGKPSWGEDCIMCFACLQWCPQQAIQAGKITVGKPRYHHPDVKVSDIVAQKRLEPQGG
jgi:ferredoxin